MSERRDLLSVAYQYLGMKEIPGPGFNPWLKHMWLSLKGGTWFWKQYGEDDTKLPWCGAFLAFICQENGFTFPQKYASALAWREFCIALPAPLYGCIAVQSRGKGAGHAGLVTAVSSNGLHVRLLGGNQNDSVSLQWFRKDDFSYHTLIGLDLDGIKPPTLASASTFNVSVL